MDDLLFYRGGELRNALEARGQKMRQAVEAEPEENLKQVHVDEWAAALAHHFAVTCPVLKVDEVWMEPPKPVKLDVSRDPGRYFSDYASDLARNYPGERIIVHVPFEGEADVFKLKTSTWSTTFPRGRIQGNDLLVTVDYPARPDAQRRRAGAGLHQRRHQVPRLGGKRDRRVQRRARAAGAPGN